MEEVAILNTLDHPNICKYFETYDDSKYIYLVMELISGGQLFDKITSQENQTFTEKDACKYMRDLFSAINHCHAQGVIHRDIKPENIMITETGDLKLIDFGLAKAGKTKNLKTIAGTPYYMAPEVLDGNYGAECDMWSLGVILYTLVSGYLPFQGQKREEVFSKIKEGSFHFNHPEFKIISDECKELIKKLLVVRPKDRVKGVDVLKHAWFTKFELNTSLRSNQGAQIDLEVLDRLKSFKGVSTLRKAALNMMVKMIDDRELENLREQFREIDEDGTGMIKASELAAVLRKRDLNMSNKEVEDLINEIDYHGNGKINYTEFLAATVSINKFMTDRRMRAIFSQFDTNNNGFITEENITLAMEKMGQNISDEEVKSIIKKHDKTKNNKLSYEEFVAMFGEFDQPFGSDGPGKQ